MRIVIDMQGAQTGSRLRGIGRYSTALASAMIRNRRGHEVLICLSGLFPDTIESVRSAFAGLVPDENIVVWRAVSPVFSLDPANDWRRGAAEILREEFLDSLQADVIYVSSLVEGFQDDAVHSVGRYGRRSLVGATFYDVIPLIQREVYLDPNPGLLASYSEKLGHLKRADLLFAISESARGEAIRYLGRSPDDVVNIGTAVDDQFRVVNIDAATRAALSRKFGFRDGYVMYSGATDERKNHLRLIEAYALLPEPLRARFPLLIVGGMPAQHAERFAAHARSFGLTAAEFVLTGRVTDDDLVALYNLCSLFVLPSWHEGFGLPALEAMSCGAAVIGSNTTSIPEVIGRDDALFDPYSALSIKQRMMQVLEDEPLRLSLAAHGLLQARKFSWDKSAGLTLDALERAVAARPASVVDTVSRDPQWRLASLASHIAALPSAGRTDQDLLAIANAISFNVSPSAGRSLFVDVSAYVTPGRQSDNRSTALSLLDELTHTESARTTVIPIQFDSVHFRRVSIDRDASGLLRFEPTCDIAELRRHDVYLSLGANPAIGVARDAFLRLRQFGTDVYFLIAETPFQRETVMPVETDMHAVRWLADVVDVATGLLCLSSNDEIDVRRWMTKHPPRRPDLPLVCNVGPGSSIIKDASNPESQATGRSAAEHWLHAVGLAGASAP